MDRMTKMDYEKRQEDRKSRKDFKMRYIHTSNLEKIGDLHKDWNETDEKNKQERKVWTRNTKERRLKTDESLWKHLP